MLPLCCQCIQFFIALCICMEMVNCLVAITTEEIEIQKGWYTVGMDSLTFEQVQTLLQTTLYCRLHVTLYCRLHVTLYCRLHFTVGFTLHFTVDFTLHFTVDFTLHFTVDSTLHFTVDFTLHFTVDFTLLQASLYCPYRQYINLFIFRFVSEHYLSSTLHLCNQFHLRLKLQLKLLC